MSNWHTFPALLKMYKIDQFKAKFLESVSALHILELQYICRVTCNNDIHFTSTPNLAISRQVKVVSSSRQLTLISELGHCRTILI